MSETSAETIRISAKAIVIADGRVLLVRYKSDTDEWFTLPGGGQQFGETLSQTIARECLEETGYLVVPGPLKLVREYIGANHQFAQHDGGVHQVELMFTAELAEKNDKELIADRNQIGFEWIRLSEVRNVRLFPSSLRILIGEQGFDSQSPIYLGDIN